MKKDCVMNKKFSIGQPVTRSDYKNPRWTGHIIAIYDSPFGLRYAVQRNENRIFHYDEWELQAVRQKPILSLLQGGKYNAQSEKQRAVR